MRCSTVEAVSLAAFLLLSEGARCQQSVNYPDVLKSTRYAGLAFEDLPGFSRGGYHEDHALITPENQVWSAHKGWSGSLVAHLISPAAPRGTNFAMYLVNMQANGTATQPQKGIERLIFVLDGHVTVHEEEGPEVQLHADDFSYLPPHSHHRIESAEGAGLVVLERVHHRKGKPTSVHGRVSKLPNIPVPGEVFQLKKLLPQTPAYDFNIHIMDFEPGEYLNVKEIHYNQHGLLLLQGQGIYRLADKWYPVQAGDVIWMAPYVLQWYAALGTTTSRYLLYKDELDSRRSLSAGQQQRTGQIGVSGSSGSFKQLLSADRGKIQKSEPKFKQESQDPGRVTSSRDGDRSSRQQPKYGLHPLGIGSRREGLIYTPESYSEAHDKAAPLIVMLHGAGGNAAGAIKFMSSYADEAGAVILATESEKGTWDVIWNEYGKDVQMLDEALDSIFSRYTINPDMIAVGGFSDGATYALSLGVTNGDLFKHIVAFSPGFMRPGEPAGSPRVFISHGTNDQVLPCDRCGRRLASELKGDGFSVDYREFKGPHEVPAAISQQGMQWFLGHVESATELVQKEGHTVVPT
ncbi:hypothetical protein WJX74_002602 [Apatococcus lobatus]|uniref:Uncharacterized protein n=1 Tax=Apatococcus lobatus TaxID=904363 RepID=A0AAW1QCD8_9CHLO